MAYQIIMERDFDSLIPYHPHSSFREFKNDYYSGNYIYRLYDKDKKVLYVGKSKAVLNRIRSHLSPTESFLNKWKKKIAYVDFAKVKGGLADMAIYEIFYINKYQDVYNKTYNFESFQAVTLKPLRFIPLLSTKDFRSITKK